MADYCSYWRPCLTSLNQKIIHSVVSLKTRRRTETQPFYQVWCYTFLQCIWVSCEWRSVQLLWRRTRDSSPYAVALWHYVKRCWENLIYTLFKKIQYEILWDSLRNHRDSRNVLVPRCGSNLFWWWPSTHPLGSLGWISHYPHWSRMDWNTGHILAYWSTS